MTATSHREPALRDQDGDDSVDNVVPDGLLVEDAKEIRVAEAKAIASGTQPSTLEGPVDAAAEKDGANRHDGLLAVEARSMSVTHPQKYATGSTFTEKRLRELLEEWMAWCDAEARAVGAITDSPPNLEAIMECPDVDATDRNLDDRLLINLDDYAAPEQGETYRRRGNDVFARWQQHLTRRPLLSRLERIALTAHIRALPPSFSNGRQLPHDFGANVQIVRDRGSRFPPGDPAAFVRGYVSHLPIGWNSGVVISLRDGEHPVLCRWSERRVCVDDTKAWCRANGPEGKPRFEALENFDFHDYHRELIPTSIPATAAATIQSLAAPPAPSKVGVQVHPTGIAPLDAVLATGGVPAGGRVVVQAATAQAKTTLLLEVAEGLAARKLCVAWIATADEPREMIQARRRQRRGVSRQDALASEDEDDLACILVVDGRRHTLEEVLACPGIDVLMLDPISKVRTTSTASDPVSRVGHALDLVEAAGITCWMTVPVVRAAGRRASTERAFGGARIEAGATLLLELHRSGSDLSVGLIKSRLGGEGSEIALRIDAERQRIFAPSGGIGAAGPVAERIWTDVRQLLVERGALSARALTAAVRGKAIVVRGVIREQLAAGALVDEAGQLRLA